MTASANSIGRFNTYRIFSYRLDKYGRRHNKQFNHMPLAEGLAIVKAAGFVVVKYQREL